MKREDLLTALGKVKPGLARNDEIEQATSFAFMKGRVVTFNDEISISHPVPDMNVEGAVFAEELYQFLAKSSSEEIEMELTKGEIKISSGRAKAWLTLKTEILMPLEEIGREAEWKKIPKEFMKGLDFVSFSCSKDSARPSLNCINVQASGIIESTDGMRITQFKLGKKLPVDPFLLPLSSAKELGKYTPTQIGMGKGWVHFKTEDDTTFSCRIYLAKFPDTSAHIKPLSEGVEIKFPKGLSDVLERAVIFGKKDNEEYHRVEIKLEDGKITLRAQSSTARFEESTRIQYRGDSIEFAINPNFLLGILDRLRTCMIEATNPIRGKIRFEGDKWIHMAMLTRK